MVDVVLATEDLTVFGGPSSINVDVDFGPTGPRGSRIYGVSADPRLATTEKPPSLQNFDIAMVITPSEPDYLTVYQKIGVTNEEWVQFATLVPNIFATKMEVEFTAGLGLISLQASDLFILDEYTADKFMVQIGLENENPLLNRPVSTGISLSVATISNKKVLNITVTAAEIDPSTGIWSPVSGNRLAHIFATTTVGVVGGQ
jgi:hypothetical protein